MKNLEIYVHIPFCVKKCDYCDFLSMVCDEKTQNEYVNCLLNEIEYYGKYLREYEISTVYIGGGTPSWLDESAIVSILTAIGRNYNVRADVEASIECNPGTVTKAKLESYYQAGINRLSIGLQSPDNAELKLLGRIHTFEQFLKTYEMARNTGFSNINIDIINSLPYQNAEKFVRNLNKVIRLRPEHISNYSLIIEEGTKFYERYKFDDVKQHAGMKTDVLPDEDEAYKIYKMGQKTLREAGYIQYEISNFAKPGFACRHNVGYWDRVNYLGVGLGAASLIENMRYTNEKDIYDYMKKTKDINFRPDGGIATNLHESIQKLSRREQMEEFMFLGLRKLDGILRRDFESYFGISIESVFSEPINKLKSEGLLEVREGRIYLSDKGMDLANYCMAEFLQ